jgi:hypothetical protein
MTALAPAVKQRRYRLRMKEGLSVVTLDLDLDLVREALVACGQLTPQQAQTPDLMKRELMELVHTWAWTQLEAKAR